MLNNCLICFILWKSVETDCLRYCSTLAYGYLGTIIEIRVDSQGSFRYIVRKSPIQFKNNIL